MIPELRIYIEGAKEFCPFDISAFNREMAIHEKSGECFKTWMLQRAISKATGNSLHDGTPVKYAVIEWLPRPIKTTMNTDELFEIPESISPRLKLEREWIAEYEIMTHHADIDENPWLAVSMKVCKSRLEGHDLTSEEKTDVGSLFAGYGRLLDEGNMVGYGSTKEAAIEDLVKKGVIPSREAFDKTRNA